MSAARKILIAATAAAALVVAVLLFLHSLPRTDAPRAFPAPALGDENLILVIGDSYNLDDEGNQANRGTFPFIIFLDPRDWSTEVLNLHTLFPDRMIDVVSNVEVRLFLHNGQHKLALATRGPDSVNGTVFILRKVGRSWRDLEIEFQEKLPYPFVRALAIGDVTGDGESELVVGTRTGGVVRYYSFADGQWSGQTIDKLGIDEEPSVAIHDIIIEDLDEDGLNEILLTAHIPFFRLSDWDKEYLPPFKPQLLQYKFNQAEGTWTKELVREYTETDPLGIGGRELPHPLDNPYIREYYPHLRYLYFVDVDGDNVKEIVSNQRGKDNEYLVELKRQGTSYVQTVIEEDLPIDRQILSLGDIDGDGKSEILAATEAHDFLLLYEHEQGKWERRSLATQATEGRPDRFIPAIGRRARQTSDEANIQAAAIINSSEGKYKNILYAVSGREADNTLFYLFSYDPPKDAWETEIVAEVNIGTHAWHILPPK